jgi:hypothetical protein
MIPMNEMTPWQWWQSKRLKYNWGLVKAGFFAFVAYAISVEIFIEYLEDVEITLFTMLFHGLFYLFAILVANIVYTGGPLLEYLLRPTDASRYRKIAFNSGYWFSFVLPFSVPLLMISVGLKKIYA